jgi:glycosyltransferase involved in cell wall biosynthesis
VQIKISIVLATFNAQKFVADLLSSIAPQKTNEIELIVVDGYSTDNTIKIVKSSELADIIISEPDEGIYDAWNKGISASSGLWIMFVGADDQLMPETLNLLIDMTNTVGDEIDYISGKNYYIDDCDRVVNTFGWQPIWTKMRRWMVAAHVSSLHNQRLFREIGMFNTKYKICADYELLLRKRDALRYIFVDKYFAKMRVGGVSYSQKAIYESYLIRRNLRTVGLLYNFSLFFYNSIAFLVSKLRARFL